jgi:hypothetical protein
MRGAATEGIRSEWQEFSSEWSKTTGERDWGPQGEMKDEFHRGRVYEFLIDRSGFPQRLFLTI